MPDRADLPCSLPVIIDRVLYLFSHSQYMYTMILLEMSPSLLLQCATEHPPCVFEGNVECLFKRPNEVSPLGLCVPSLTFRSPFEEEGADPIGARSNRGCKLTLLLQACLLEAHYGIQPAVTSESNRAYCSCSSDNS